VVATLVILLHIPAVALQHGRGALADVHGDGRRRAAARAAQQAAQQAAREPAGALRLRIHGLADDQPGPLARRALLRAPLRGRARLRSLPALSSRAPVSSAEPL